MEPGGVGAAGGMPPGMQFEDGHFIDQEGNRFKLVAYDAEGNKVTGADEALADAAPKVFQQLQEAQEGGAGLPSDLTAVKLNQHGIDLGDRVVKPAQYDTLHEEISHIASHAFELQEAAAKEVTPSSDFGARFSAVGKEMKERFSNLFKGIQKRASSAFQAIGKFFKKIEMPKLLLKIGVFFEKKITPQAYQTRLEGEASSMFTRTESKLESRLGTLKDFKLGEALTEEEHASYQTSAHICVPKELMMDKEDRKVRLFDKKIGAKQAADKGLHEEVAPFENRGTTTTGYKVDATSGDMTEGKVVPTSFRTGRPEEANHLMNCYLTVNDKGDKGVIRTGVIDSPEKAAEFMVAAKKQQENLGGREGRPLRLVSHQVNSPEREGKMIENQHQCLAQAERNSGDGTQVVHLNMPSNRFYEYTQDYGHLDPSGVFLGGERKSHEQNIEGMATYLQWIVEDLEILAKDAGPGDEQGALSAAVNLLKVEGEGRESQLNKTLELRESIQTALGGIQDKQDALKKAAGELEGERKAIEELEKEIKALEQEMEADGMEALPDEEAVVEAKRLELEGKNTALTAKRADLEVKKTTLEMHEDAAKENEKTEGNAIKALKKEIRAAREELNSPNLPGSLQSHYRALASLEGIENLPPAQKQTIALFRRLMGMQLEVEGFPEADKMDRGQELLCWALLDQQLGVVMAINCKSGLDRTGFFHSAILGLMEIAEPEEAFNVVTQWDKLTDELNRLYMENDYDTTRVKDAIAEAAEAPGRNGQELELVFQMRKNVLDHMLNVSLPITGHSTGLIGLKWGKGMQANRIPLNFIPPVIQVISKEKVVVSTEEDMVEEGTGDKEKMVVTSTRIVEYNNKGKPEGLTKKGHQLLTQLSPYRGA